MVAGVTMGSGLATLGGYPFAVRYSRGASARARTFATLVANAYDYLRDLFPDVTLDIAVIVADRRDWRSRQPYGLAYFDDADDQIAPGIVVVPAGRGDFWAAMVEDLRESSTTEHPMLVATYPDGAGGVDLQPFFDLVSVHELGHALEVQAGVRLPTLWLSEIFANLVLHAYVYARQPESAATLEVLATVGARTSRRDHGIRSPRYRTLEDLETHYTGGERPMDPLNYVWYQYRWQRLAAAMFDADGEDGLIRFANFFRAGPDVRSGPHSAISLAPLLSAEVSEVLAHAVREWR